MRESRTRFETARMVAPIAVVLLAIVVRVGFFFFISDDALITMRHSKNLIQGEGLQFNQGERVMGSSTPLFSILVAGWGLVAPESMVSAGKAMGLVADVGVVLIIYFMAAATCGSYCAFIGACYYALNPLAAQWSVSGMETSVYVLLIIAALWLCEKRRSGWSGLLAGGAVLARPDGLAVLGANAAYSILFIRRVPWRMLLMATVVVVPWLVFSVVYFGQMVPQSVVGKTAQAWPAYTTAMKESWGYLVTNPYRLPFTVLAIVGVVVGWRRRSCRAVVIWSAAYIAGFTLTRARMYAWYCVPVEMAGAVFLAFGFSAIDTWATARSIGRAWAHRLLAVGRVAIIACMIGLSLFRVGIARQRLRLHTDYLNDTHRAMGLWLHEDGQPDQKVAMGDIGYVGWFSGLHILDHAGLVSPDVLALKEKTGEGFVAAFLSEYRPDYYLYRTEYGGFLAQDVSELFASEGYRHIERYPPVQDITRYGLMNGRKRAYYDVFTRDSAAPLDRHEGGPPDA